MLYRISLEDGALDDIEQATKWIARNVRANRAKKMSAWLDALHAALGSLERLPQRCPLARENDFLSADVRQLLFQQHRIIYTVIGGTVHILHVRHQRQRPLTREDF